MAQKSIVIDDTVFAFPFPQKTCCVLNYLKYESAGTVLMPYSY